MGIYLGAIRAIVEKILAAAPPLVGGGPSEPCLRQVLEALDRLDRGEPFRPFDISLVLYRGRDLEQLRIVSRGEAVTVSEGGFVYDAARFGDIYGDWEFTVWPGGQSCGTFRLDEGRLQEMLTRGAELLRELPAESM